MLHYWDAYWDLRIKECPCDVHFCDWLESAGVTNARIFHFGTGGHHIVGIRTAENGSNNGVIGITAAPKEYDDYVKLSIEKPLVAKSYKVFFGDIYQLDARLLPELEVVTNFHLCEFRSEKNDEYNALTDEAMTRLLIDKLVSGGRILFYPGSFAWDNAKTIVAKLEAEGVIVADGAFETLVIYKKP